MTPTLFLWNEGPYAALLREQGYTVATSYEEVRRLRRQRAFRKAPLVVLAEWAPGGKLAEFEGLRFVARLFDAESSVPPLVLCSFLDQEALMGLDEDERGAAARLTFPFVRLPALPDVLAGKAAEAEDRVPSPMVQAWLREHELGPHRFEKWLHDFRQDAAGDPANLREAFERLRERSQSRRSSVEAALGDWGSFDALLAEGLKAVHVGENERAVEIAGRLKGELDRAKRHATGTVASSPRSPYSVFLVEDREEALTHIVDGLAPYFEDVVPFRRGDAALREMERRSGEGTPVHAVVSDWVLREGGETDGVLQPIQGPDVLLRSAQFCPGPLVGLTLLSGSVVAGIMRAAPADVRARLTWFHKRENLAEQDYETLAHYITVKVKESLTYRREAPAGFKDWEERGLADYYASIRSRTPEAQRAYFEECAGSAEAVVKAYAQGDRTVDVSEEPFSLSLNARSGGRRFRPDELEDILVGRLAFLTLYGHLPRRERNYQEVLSALYPQMVDRYRARIENEEDPEGAFPPSFNTIMMVLGLPRHGDEVAVGSLKLMPHEEEWLGDGGLNLGHPVLSKQEQEDAYSLEDDATQIVADLHRAVSEHGTRLNVQQPYVPDSPSTAWAAAEEAVSLLQAAASALMEAAWEEPLVQEVLPEAVARFVREVEMLTDEGVFEDLYAKEPEWKVRIGAIPRQLGRYFG